MKYIVFEDFSGQPAPFLFPEKVNHADMREQMPYTKVLSAGYVVLEKGKVVCFGGDVSIGFASRPEEDAACIRKFFEKE